eukprot:357341-Prymnesium_polylepis.1
MSSADSRALRCVAEMMPHRVSHRQLVRAVERSTSLRLLDDALSLILDVGREAAKPAIEWRRYQFAWPPQSDDSWYLAGCASSVCSAWADLCGAWRASLLRLHITLDSDRQAWAVARSCPMLQELWIAGVVSIIAWEENERVSEDDEPPVHARQSAQLDDFGLQAIAHGCPSLRCLVVHECHGIGPGVLSHLHHMQLTQLTVVDCFRFCVPEKEFGDSLAAMGHPTLQRLQLHSCNLKNSTGDGAVRCAAAASALLELDLTYTEVSSGFFARALKACTRLRRLDVSYEAVGEAILAAAAHCPELEELNLVLFNEDDKPADHAWARLAAGCPRLRAVTLENVDGHVVQALLQGV